MENDATSLGDRVSVTDKAKEDLTRHKAQKILSQEPEIDVVLQSYQAKRVDTVAEHSPASVLNWYDLDVD